jgi:uncharacterized membrane protein YciS (DUF1049 family)
MTAAPQTLLMHLRIVGVVMAWLVVVNLYVPRRFHWREEMSRLSLLNRQMFSAIWIYVSSVFAAALWTTLG